MCYGMTCMSVVIMVMSMIVSELLIRKRFQFLHVISLEAFTGSLQYELDFRNCDYREVFSEQEIAVLTHLNKTLQGKRLKTQNHHNPDKTKWAAWIIGRLGGWKGYVSQGPPGVICLKRGLDKFNNIMEGIAIAKDMCTV